MCDFFTVYTMSTSLIILIGQNPCLPANVLFIFYLSWLFNFEDAFFLLTLTQCFGSGFAWIRIKKGLPDPDLHGQEVKKPRNVQVH